MLTPSSIVWNKCVRLFNFCIYSTYSVNFKQTGVLDKLSMNTGCLLGYILSPTNNSRETGFYSLCYVSKIVSLLFLYRKKSTKMCLRMVHLKYGKYLIYTLQLLNLPQRSAFDLHLYQCSLFHDYTFVSATAP